MNTIHLVIGVPGSGKTHVCKQLESKYLYIAHDEHTVEDYHKALIQAAKWGDGDVLAECPFRASVLVEELRKAGCLVREYYLTEPLETIIKRYETRDCKPFQKAFITNYHKYAERSPRYDQKELLEVLNERAR